MNTPDRGDYYVMQATREVKRSYVKDPNTVQMDEFKIPFQRQQSVKVQKVNDVVSVVDGTDGKDIDAATKNLIARDIQRLGGKVTTVVISRKEYEERQAKDRQEWEERQRLKQSQ